MWDEWTNFYATDNWTGACVNVGMAMRIKARMIDFEAFVKSLAVALVFRVEQIWRARPVRPSRSVVLFQPRWSCKRWRSKT